MAKKKQGSKKRNQAKNGDQRRVEALVRRIKATEDIFALADDLARGKSRAKKTELIALAKNPDPTARAVAYIVIARTHQQWAMDEFMSAWDDDSIGVRSIAVEQLYSAILEESWNGSRNLRFPPDVFQRELDPDCRAMVASLLASPEAPDGGQHGRDWLIQAAEGEESTTGGHVRMRAISELSRLRHPEAGVCLVRLLSSPDWDVREAAAYGLGFRQDMSFIEPLQTAHREACSKVSAPQALRAAVVMREAIGRLGASQTMMAALLEEERGVLRAAKGNKKIFEPTLARFRTWTVALGRRHILLSLLPVPEARTAMDHPELDIVFTKGV